MHCRSLHRKELEKNGAYTRARLGLANADVIRLDGPFDYRLQARLVALSDFPSWAEQPKQAMRTVAARCRAGIISEARSPKPVVSGLRHPGVLSSVGRAPPRHGGGRWIVTSRT